MTGCRFAGLTGSGSGEKLDTVPDREKINLDPTVQNNQIRIRLEINSFSFQYKSHCFKVNNTYSLVDEC